MNLFNVILYMVLLSMLAACNGGGGGGGGGSPAGEVATTTTTGSAGGGSISEYPQELNNVILINNGDLYTYDANVTLNFNSNIASQMYITNSEGCNNGGTFETFSNSKQWLLASTNTYSTVYVKFKNASGYESICYSANITHDNIVPSSTSMMINSGALATSSINVSLDIFASGVSEMIVSNTADCTSGGTWETFNNTKNWILGQSNSTAAVFIKFRDLAGNETECISDSIVHDNIAPSSTSININNGNLYTNSTSVILALASLGATEMYITNSAGCISGGTWETYATAKNWIVSQPNGVSTIYAKFRNIAHDESGCISDSIIHDNIAPTSTSLAINGGDTNTNATSALLNLSASGATSMYITNVGGCLTGGSWEAFSCTKAWFLGQTNGTATVYVKFMDESQNESNCISDTITHSSPGPSSISLAINGGRSSTNSLSVSLTLGATGPSQMYITNTIGCASGGTWEDFSTTKAWGLGQNNGVATVYVKFRDGSDYESNCIQDSIQILDLYDTNGIVASVVANGSSIYIGGDFTEVYLRTGAGVIIKNANCVSIDCLGSNISNLTTSPKVLGIIYTSVSDESGGFYIGGDFTKVGNSTRRYIAHVLSDGTVDPYFNPDPNGIVYALAKKGTSLFVGGAFTSIGGISQNRLVQLNATTGQSLVNGFNPNPYGTVYSLLFNGNDLYVGGSFGVGKVSANSGVFNFTSQTNGTVYSMAVNPYSGSIYVGGSFTQISSINRNYIAELNLIDISVDPHFNPNPNSTVNALAMNNGVELYAGGTFTSIGGLARNRLAKIDSTNGAVDVSFNPNVSNGDVNTLTLNGNKLYVGGSFTNVGGLARNRVAKIDTDTRIIDTNFNPSANGPVLSITMSGTGMYLGGSFTSILGMSRKGIAKINTSTGRVDSDFNPQFATAGVNTIAISGSNLYASGGFTSVGSLVTTRIAKLDVITGASDPVFNPSPSTSTIGASAAINTIAASGNDLYVGGQFTTIGGASRKNFAKLNGITGIADADFIANADNSVYTIALNGSDVYVGGGFDTIKKVGTASRSGIAKVNSMTGAIDTKFNLDLTGPDVWVTSILVNNGSVYFGGYFTRIGGVSGTVRINLAKVSATNGALDANFNPDVSYNIVSLLLNGNDLYLGGSFPSVGGIALHGIAKINSNTGALDSSFNLNPMNSSPNKGNISSLAIFGNDVYVGGSFLFFNSEASKGLGYFPLN